MQDLRLSSLQLQKPFVSVCCTQPKRAPLNSDGFTFPSSSAVSWSSGSVITQTKCKAFAYHSEISCCLSARTRWDGLARGSFLTEKTLCIHTANRIINSAEALQPSSCTQLLRVSFLHTSIGKVLEEEKSNVTKEKSIRVFIIQHSRTKILSLKCFFFFLILCEQLGHRLLSVTLSDLCWICLSRS